MIKDGAINHEAELGLVKIPIDRQNEPLGQKEKIILEANLHVPQNSGGIVLFAHGSGSSRHNPRNQLVVTKLNESGLATLLLDLLTPEEAKIDDRTRELRFNIDLLSNRLTSAVDWVANNHDTKNLIVGLFGASTGAAAVLVSASERPEIVSAVVSRGGRPELAGKHILRKVEAPTLFLVGADDQEILKFNESALKEIKAEKKKLTVISGATHLFEEPGKLEQVARIASGWFRCYFLIKQHSHQ
ncbi:MAG TPA: dienelactone hydrolase family protein [Candidatus Nitrosopolaris sp.]|nr:dienelactone hydrolase family protein [Candidatus Nitrosopolaris sp.]